MMRQGSNSGRRPRGRTNRKQHGGGQSRTHTFDSSGPDGRVRGNARQVYEKYLTLARDASSAGNRIAAEAYYQHAEHYYRILSDSTDPQPGGRRQDERQAQANGGDSASQEGEEAAANGTTERAAEKASEPRHNGAAAKQAGEPEATGQEAEGDAPARPRRGRTRKPRTQEGGQSAKKEASPEAEEGPAAG